MNSPGNSNIMLFVFIPLIAWRIYSRLRRIVGRQRLSRMRLWITVVIYTVLLCLLGFTVHAHAERLGSLAGGLAFGVLLGIFGLRKTRFEPTPQGFFYTPNAHLGIALSLLFVARIAYRSVELYSIAPAAPHGLSGIGSSSLTLAVFGLLAGFYLTYATGLMRWRLRVLRATRQRETLPGEDRVIPDHSPETTAADSGPSAVAVPPASPP